MTGIEETIFSGNSAINSAIRKMLPYFSPESQTRMRKAILNAKRAAEKHSDENTDANARHIFREFIPAYILNKHGFTFEYEKTIYEKNPDWLDDTSRLIMESYTCERGASSSFLDRIKSAATDKCSKYRDIIEANNLRFIVAVYWRRTVLQVLMFSCGIFLLRIYTKLAI